jgi:hypothetical protein
MAKKRKRYVTTRKVYKAVKRYDHSKFDEFCNMVYTEGYRDCMEEMQLAPKSKAQPSVSMEEVLKVIGEVKGVGPALAGRIRMAVEELMNGMEEGGVENDAGN